MAYILKGTMIKVLIDAMKENSYFHNQSLTYVTSPVPSRADKCARQQYFRKVIQNQY